MIRHIPSASAGPTEAGFPCFDHEEPKGSGDDCQEREGRDLRNVDHRPSSDLDLPDVRPHRETACAEVAVRLERSIPQSTREDLLRTRPPEHRPQIEDVQLAIVIE